MPVNAVTNSKGLIVRDSFLERLQLLPFFDTFKKFSRTKQMQIQPEHLPYCGCYIVDETLVPDGDANAGEVRFVHSLRLGFSVIVKNNDPDETEVKLDQGYWAIMGLLSQDILMNMFSENTDSGRVIEGFSRGMKRMAFGTIGRDNEIPMGELQLELTATFRTSWPPVITDDLELIHVETRFPPGGTPAEQAAVLQVKAEYDLTAEEE